MRDVFCNTNTNSEPWKQPLKVIQGQCRWFHSVQCIQPFIFHSLKSCDSQRHRWIWNVSIQVSGRLSPIEPISQWASHRWNYTKQLRRVFCILLPSTTEGLWVDRLERRDCECEKTFVWVELSKVHVRHATKLPVWRHELPNFWRVEQLNCSIETISIRRQFLVLSPSCDWSIFVYMLTLS